MRRRKIIINKAKNVKINRYVILLFFVLVLISLFSAANLIAVVELRKQVSLTLGDINNAAISAPVVSGGTDKSFTPAMPLTAEATPSLITDNEHHTYSNAASEPFFGDHFIDNSKTDMRLDEIVTALTFFPIYDLNPIKTCTEPLCGLRDKGDPSCLPHGCLTESGGQIYYNSKKIELPGELQDKDIINFTFSPLETKWVIGIVVKSGSEEEGFVYLFDGNRLELLINEGTQVRIMTKFSHGGGRISAGGSDKQFMVLYSGFEAIGYIYGNNKWQEITPYFSLRTQKNGFKAKIIKGGSGKLATWYVCSEDLAKPKLIKLWQNETDQVQGSIDLSSTIEGGPAICAPKDDREISIARNLSGQDTLYSFKDKGFDNSKTYHYQSNNLSNDVGKNILDVNLYNYLVNATKDSYSIMISQDKINWQKYVSSELKLEETGLDTFYIKADFKPGGLEYSPWFGGMDIISYQAEDR